MLVKKPIPFEFVLEKLSSLNPTVKPMFGCHAIYVEEKIVLIVRQKKDHPRDNGIWLATRHSFHESLRSLFPNMRSIEIFGGQTEWQVLPETAEDFEESALIACKLILKGDERIGKIPARKRASRTQKKEFLKKVKTKRNSIKK